MSDTDTPVVSDASAETWDDAKADAEWASATSKVKGLAAADEKPTESKPAPEKGAAAKPAEEKPDDGKDPDDDVTPADDTAAGDELDDDPADDVDIWADANDAQKAAWTELESKYKALEHKQKSDDGRVSALQRKLNELEQELQKRPAPPPAEESDAWKKFQEDAPDDAKAVEQMLSEREAELNAKLNATIFNTTMDTLRPSWRDDAQDKGFLDWKAQQPEAIQAKYKSTTPADAISLLKMYDEHKAAAKAKAEKIKAERKEKLEKSETVRGNGAGKDAEELGDDLDTLWQAESAKVREKLGLNRLRR